MNMIIMQMYYTSLTGNKVERYENESIEIYKKEDLEFMFLDPISLEYLREPVYFNDHVFSRETISRWFREHDRDPMTNEIITLKEICLFPFNLINYLLYAFEEKDDKLIFHSPPNCLKFAQTLGKYMINVNSENVHQLSVLSHKDKFKIENNNIKYINTFSLKKYLTTNICTGKKMKLKNIHLVGNGFTIDRKIQKVTDSNVKNLIGHNKNCVNVSKYIKRIYDAVDRKYKPIEYDDYYFKKYLKQMFPKSDKLNIINITSEKDKCLAQVDKILEMIDQDVSMKNAFGKINNLLTNDTLNKVLKVTYYNSEINDLRNTLQLPFIEENNMWGCN